MPPCGRRRLAPRRLLGARLWIARLWIALGVACAAPRAPRPSPEPPPPSASPAADFPDRALDLLTESTTDSCSICAERHRREAFADLEQAYAPGVIIRSTVERRFRRVAGAGCELALTSYVRSEPGLTFRFHVASDHLVGIAETDFTDEAIAGRLRSLPEGRELDGAIRIVPFPYGDGASFLFSPARNHLEIQCKVVRLGSD